MISDKEIGITLAMKKNYDDVNGDTNKGYNNERVYQRQ